LLIARRANQLARAAAFRQQANDFSAAALLHRKTIENPNYL
jgi:hypothetical protein